MGVVKEAIADRVRHRGVPEVLVPLVGRELACDDRRPGLAAILQDLEQVAPVLIPQRAEAPVLEHEDVDASELAEEADVGAVGMSEGEFVEEPGHAAVERPISLAAGLLGKGAGKEALPRPRRPGDQELLVFVDPAAGGELTDDGLVELAAGWVVDRLDAGLAEAELRLAERVRQALVLPREPFGLDEEAEPLIEAEGARRRILLLRDPGRGDGVEP